MMNTNDDQRVAMWTVMGMNAEMFDMRSRAINVLVVGALLVLAGCGSAQADSADDVAASEEFVRVINVEVALIATETFVEEIRLTSVAMANQDVMLEAEETGRIVRIYVDRGDRVGAGDRIAKIDNRVLQAQVNQASSAAQLAQQTWERRKRLFEEEQVGSEIAYLEEKFGAEQAAATLQGLEERLARTVVRAPFAGILDERHVDVGTMVGPGKTVGRLVDLDPIKVFAGVPERYATDVHVGARAQLVFEAVGTEVYAAPIRYVGASIDPRSRTFPIEIEVPNQDHSIKPQMVGNMAITRQEVAEAIVVPQDALLRVEDGYVVYVAIEQGGHMVAEVRGVILGPTRRNLVVVEDGLVAGEQLVVVGQKSVANGDRVNVVANQGG
ncbi:MAG: efflux RND transporter periplasmic adaptor subunit [Longimicrobiales bacterium]|nr:efflux RND transporter periplasmic adaptor subunit [Longimicrobiales bacterium]